MIPYSLKKRTMKRWIFLISGWAAWLIFVYNIPSDLSYPWNMLNILLGISSPCLWYATLRTGHRSVFESEIEPKGFSGIRSRMPIRYWTYFIAGMVAWAIFVYNISSNPNYLWRALDIFIGAAPPFLWLNAMMLDDMSTYEDQGDSKGSFSNLSTLTRTQKKACIYFLSGVVAWLLFVSRVVSNFHPPWDIPYSLLGYFAPYLWGRFYNVVLGNNNRGNLIQAP